MLPQDKAQRQQRASLPLPSLTPDQVGAMLLARRLIDDATGCWLWTGNRLPRGYGRLGVGARHYLVHRLAAYAFLGYDLSAQTLILHSCDNPPCFNPDHLRAGTQYDNWRDRARGEPERRKGRYKADLSVVYALIDAGWSQAQVGQHLGVSSKTVCYYLRHVRPRQAAEPALCICPHCGTAHTHAPPGSST